MQAEALISARVAPGKEEAGAKYSYYFDHREGWARIPAHRALALLRAAKEEIVTLDIAPDPDTGAPRAVATVAAAIGIHGDAPGDRWLRDAAAWTWRRHDGASVGLAGLNLGVIGLTGHAVLPPGTLGVLHQILSVLHLQAGGFWIGSLPFVLTLLGKPGETKLLKRLSVVGHVAVATVLLTGLAKTAIIQTSRPVFDPSVTWSLLLGIKILAVLTMTALALRNRYRLVPMGDAGLAALRSGTLAEIVLSVAVLSLISLLATLSPFAS